LRNWGVIQSLRLALAARAFIPTAQIQSALRRVFSHVAEQEIAQYRILAKLGAGGTVVSLPEVGLQEGLSIPS
jgi:hypothetical protein